MGSGVCEMCEGTGEIYRPAKKKWVNFYLIDSDGCEERHQKLETSGGIDACPACAATAEADWKSGGSRRQMHKPLK